MGSGLAEGGLICFYEEGNLLVQGFRAEAVELIIISVECDGDGNPKAQAIFSSKSGENFNHKAEWEYLNRSITEGRPFNYYPRGRVEIRNGKATIFLNPNIKKENVLCKIIEAFELVTNDELKAIRVKSDGSNHYKYTRDNM